MVISLETSAIIALLLDEKEAPKLVAQLSQASKVHCPASCGLEAIIVLVRKQKMTANQAREMVFRLLDDFDVAISALDRSALELAVEGYSTYGKGRGLSPALLNFCDCLAYGVAKATGGALLYTGDDFAATDLG